jgi:hypothetical protein
MTNGVLELVETVVNPGTRIQSLTKSRVSERFHGVFD